MSKFTWIAGVVTMLEVLSCGAATSRPEPPPAPSAVPPPEQPATPSSPPGPNAGIGPPTAAAPTPPPPDCAECRPIPPHQTCGRFLEFDCPPVSRGDRCGITRLPDPCDPSCCAE